MGDDPKDPKQPEKPAATAPQSLAEKYAWLRVSSDFPYGTDEYWDDMETKIIQARPPRHQGNK